MGAPDPSHSALAASPPAPTTLATGDPSVVIGKYEFELSSILSLLFPPRNDFLHPAGTKYFLPHQPHFKHHFLPQLTLRKRTATSLFPLAADNYCGILITRH